jgi:hypothetical protein
MNGTHVSPEVSVALSVPPAPPLNTAPKVATRSELAAGVNDPVVIVSELAELTIGVASATAIG